MTTGRISKLSVKKAMAVRALIERCAIGAISVGAILFLFLFLLSSTPVRGAEEDGDLSSFISPFLCSCSPVEYTFRLNFDGTCADGQESVCFFALGGDPANDDVDVGALSPPIQRKLHASRRKGSAVGRQHDAASPRVDFSRQGPRQRALQQRDGFDTVPTVVTSVTFLEFDRFVQDVLSQDSTYFNTTLSDGDTLVFASASAALDPGAPLADQLDSLPGGAMLVLFGPNSSGEMVQNTVAWSYDQTCEVAVGKDNLSGNGWVEVADVLPARPAFCPGADSMAPTSTDSTNTESPVVLYPTSAPSRKEAGSTAPSIAMTEPSPGVDKSSKAGKVHDPKAAKNCKSHVLTCLQPHV